MKTISYKYAYSNSQSSIEEVEKLLKADWTPDLARNVVIANNTSLSEATVNIHLHELEKRGKAIKLGKEWIHLEVAKDLEVWQLRRILERLDREHDKAVTLRERLNDKLEIRKEYLREMKEELRSNEFSREQKEIIDLESSRNYYSRKCKELREAKRKIFGLLGKTKSKESRQSSGLATKEVLPITS